MKKKVLCLGIILALALTFIMPAAATAAEPPIATGDVSYITAGETIKAAGDSGRWIVKDRYIGVNFDNIFNGACI